VKITDKMRLDFLLGRSAHYYSKKDEDLICVSDRIDIDAAIRAERRASGGGNHVR
jgi:hypothetical protein